MHHSNLTLRALHVASKELFETYHIVRFRMLHKLHDTCFACAKVTELSLQLFAIDVAGLAQDGPLQCCGFLENAADLSVASAESGSRDECPGHGCEGGKDESSKPGSVGFAGAVEVGATSGPPQIEVMRVSTERARRAVGGSVGSWEKCVNRGQESVESALVGRADKHRTKLVVQDDENEVEVLQLEFLQLDLIVRARNRSGQTGKHFL